jgi:transcriptional regulator with XRE-family HTH domain
VPTTPTRIFGQNIHRLRVTAALTQEALAEKADLSRRFLQELESGAKAATIPTVVKLRGALGCSWNELLKGL